ncbi:MAG: tyrosine--tRNA ligase [Alphaproteobacteria bacterium]|nr:tyrosine--tRNA ligase [Alphaproteobacteria bacterium]
MALTYEELARGIESIVPENGLKEKLALAEKEKRLLVVKFGMDPTAPDLHLGHAVGLKKLRQFQDAGHELCLIVGDFTACIGDPSGRNTTRPPLTADEVKANAKTYIEQLGKVVDMTKNIRVVFNGEWLNKMTAADMIKLLGKATLAQMMQREDFANRYEQNIPIALHELIYPLMQGYDSVMVRSDIEFGGRDQLFNCLVGKSLQESMGQPGQIVIGMPLLVGLDGKIKMSKSKNNYIGLTEPANDMYGKAMSIPDELIPDWVELVTNWTPDEKSRAVSDYKNGAVNPMEIKKKIAFNIVEQYHSKADAAAAEHFFYVQVQQRGFDTKEFQEVKASDLGLAAPCGLVDFGVAVMKGQSKSAIRRLIESGAVSVSGEKVTDINAKLEPTAEGLKIKIGKRGFYNLKP